MSQEKPCHRQASTKCAPAALQPPYQQLRSVAWLAAVRVRRQNLLVWLLLAMTPQLLHHHAKALQCSGHSSLLWKCALDSRRIHILQAWFLRPRQQRLPCPGRHQWPWLAELACLRATGGVSEKIRYDLAF